MGLKLKGTTDYHALRNIPSTTDFYSGLLQGEEKKKSYSELDYLCMWDRWRWGRLCRQRETPRGRREFGTLAWWACPSGIAGRRRLGEVQTHLRGWHSQTTRAWDSIIKSSVNMRFLLAAAGATSRFVWLRNAAALAESSTKRFRTRPRRLSVQPRKNKYWRTYFKYFKCIRQMCVDKPFFLTNALSFCSFTISFGHICVLHSLALTLFFRAVGLQRFFVCEAKLMHTYQNNWKAALFPFLLCHLSGFWQTRCDIIPLSCWLSAAHGRSHLFPRLILCPSPLELARC